MTLVKKTVFLLVLAFALGGFLLACSDDTGSGNKHPIAEAGADQTVTVGQTATLDGSGSYDPEGETLAYTWELVEAPTGGQATLSATDSVTTGLTPDVEGTWVVRLIVSDGSLDSEPDVVQVEATAEQPCQNDSDCNNNDVCDGLETCVNGSCQAGTALNCDDSNVCTDDSCDATNGCQTANNTAACDDGDACSMNDACADGSCSGEPLDADGDGYVSDACQGGDDCDDAAIDVNPGATEGPSGDAKCSDTVDNDCDGDTDDADLGCQACTQDSDCDNNDVCDGVETCVNDSCVQGTALDCDDTNDCTADTCDSTNGCQNDAVADDTECGTRSCSGQDWMKQTCVSGQCTGSAVEQTCASGTTCMPAETCDPANGCVAGTAAPDGTGCDEGAGQDGDWCNSSCVSGVCTAGTAATCDDGLICNGTETCNTASGCVAGTPLADDTPCDEGASGDGNICNSSCISGACTEGSAPTCDDGEECTTDSCDTTNGCENTAVADDTECGSRFCSGQDWTKQTCQSGACTGSAVEQTCAGALVCSAAETCDPTNGCVPGSGAPDGTPCDEGAGQDSNWCNSSCQSNVCVDGTAPTCDNSLICDGTETCDNSSGCVPGTAATDGTACDEGGIANSDYCDSTCQSGVCSDTAAVDCSGSDDLPNCTVGVCTPADGTCGTGPAGSGVECRASAGECDVAETCDGTSMVCTGDTYTADDTPCDGGDSDFCDSTCQTGVCSDAVVVDCSGSDDLPNCTVGVCTPADGTCGTGPASSGVECLASAGECDVAETCDGTNMSCPVDGFVTDDTPCDGGDSDFCDSTCQTGVCSDAVAVDCSGLDDLPNCTVGVCNPADGTCGTGPANSGVECRASAGDCDVLETCDGTNMSCPVDGYATVGTACGDGIDCTLGDACDGAGVCLGLENDPYCDAIQTGDICWPGCSADSSGCLTPSTGLTVTCDDPVTAPDDDSVCDLILTGGTLTDQEACLSCWVPSGDSVTVFESADFDNPTGDDCDLNGWTLVADTGNLCSPSIQDCNVQAENQNCCATVDTANQSICDVDSFPGNPVLRADQATNCGGGVEEWRMTKTFDVTGMTDMAICFNYADLGTNTRDGVVVYVADVANPTPVEVYCDVRGPVRDVDGVFYWVCGAIPATFNNSPDMNVLVVMHSENDDNVVFIDDLELYGWIDGCAADVRIAFSDSFDACDTSNWTPGGPDTPTCQSQWDCSGDRDALQADDTAWTIETSVDATALDGFVTLCFDVGSNGTDANDEVLVEFNASGSWEEAWRLNDRLGRNNVCNQVCVNLSALNSDANNNASLGIRFDVTSIGGGDDIVLDDVSVSGFHYCSTGSVDVTLSSPPVDQGGGVYQVTATNNGGIPVTVDVQCVWDPDPTVTGSDSITFQ